MKPLEGIKVVELSTMLAGPMTARLLAEWGADVIKVESMNGDPWRKQYGTSLSPYTEHANPNFDMQNINKRFVAFNMRTPEGKEAMMKLLATADVFLTNYRVQALEQMGLTYDQLKDQFPKLVHASVLGYGSEGAEKNRPGYDYTAFCARTGFLRDFAPAGGPPIMTVAGVGDHSVAISLAGGIAAALFKRTKTGVGDKVDVSLLQMGTYIFTCGILNGFNGREYPRDRYNCAHACSNTYQGKDGEWIYLAIVDYRRFPEFCGCIGHPELAEDPRFSTQNAYYVNKADLTKILDEVFKEQTVEYWHKILNDHDLPHEICYHFKDVPYDEQVQANHYTYFHEYQDGTKTVFTNGPVHFASIDPAKIPCRESRNVGSDTKEILEELGYSDDKIQKMYEGKDMGIPANIHDIPFFKEQLLQMNMIPCGYHRYYYREEEMLAHGLEEYNDPKVGTRGQQVQQTEHELFELYKNPDLDHKPEQLAKRGGAHYSDAACETIASIYGNKLSHIVVTTKNNGSVPDLPADCAVEVSSYIGSTGARAIAFGSLQPAQRGWLQCMKNMELCVEEAAVTGDYGLLMQAFILNPQTVSGQKMVNVLNELLIAHEKYLPQFADKIAELKASGVTIKDDVARELTEKGL